MATTADYAAAYCRKYGIAIVPLPPKTKRPLKDDWGKHVLTDPDLAREFFTKNPDWNLGAALGPSRLCSLDVDDIEATLAVFAEFGWSLEDLRATFPTIQGKPGGFRVMFRVPEGVELKYHALTWPKRDGATGRFTVFELRAAHDQQRQDVLPPSIHPDTQAPYQWLTKPNGHIPEPPDFLLQVWRNWDALKPQMQAVCPWAPKPAPKPAPKSSAPREGGSVIDAYSAAHSVEEHLERYGYKRQGRRYLSPHSGTGLPGVTVLDGNKVWIHHASDPLCSDESGQPVGPFDLFCHYEHGGDVRKAVRAAAESLGLPRALQAPRREFLDPETGEIVTAPVSRRTAGVPRYIAVQEWGLDAKGDVPHASVANVVRIIQNHPQLQRTIWFDEFHDRIFTTWPDHGDPREWTDTDDIRLQAFLQEEFGLPKLGKATVVDAVLMAAKMDTRNEAKAYIEGLKWDGVERLRHFLPDCFGADDSEYTRAAGENFWISMVARVMRPGCKVDTMLVLEGVQGAGKSRALAIIGGKWFAEANASPTDKDFYLNLSGKMLVEIGEMDAFSRAEVTKVKQVITCQVDRYRAPYERRAADHPRRCVFAGTTNRDDWNKDETGARRFWPILCGEVRHDLIRGMRDQCFAEAAHKLANGATWWDMPEEATKAQQEMRRDADELEAELEEWLVGRSEVTVRQIMSELMRVPLDRQDRQLQMRIGKALRAIKWYKPTNPMWVGGRLVRVWRRRGDGEVVRSSERGSKVPDDPGALRETHLDDDGPF